MSFHPSQMHSLSAKCQKVKRQAHLGKTCVFEPSVRHKAVYTGCTTYEGIVTIDDEIFYSGVFNVVMTNTSIKHVKINNNQTMACSEHAKMTRFAQYTG